jgi:hypothetical protein
MSCKTWNVAVGLLIAIVCIAYLLIVLPVLICLPILILPWVEGIGFLLGGLVYILSMSIFCLFFGVCFYYILTKYSKQRYIESTAFCLLPLVVSCLLYHYVIRRIFGG